MQIKRTTNFYATVSDELFFNLLRGGLKLADEACIPVIWDFPHTHENGECQEQLDIVDTYNVHGHNWEIDRQFWELASYVQANISVVGWHNRELLELENIVIKPTTEDWEWENADVYGSFAAFERYNRGT